MDAPDIDTTVFVNKKLPVGRICRSDDQRVARLRMRTRSRRGVGRTSHWPTGLHAQAITTGPSIGAGANLTVSRVDGQVFDINAITFQLWANTAGAGGTLEIMPLLDGEDLYNDPVMFGATGYYSQSFSYADGGGYQSSTSALKGADAYKMHLYVDWALRSLTVDGPEYVPPPAVPEPMRGLLLMMGMTAVVLRRRRREA
jgi:hypothetical protein